MSDLPDGYEREGRETYLTAWGERKRLADWLRDDRCKFDKLSTVTSRILDQGMTPEEAMTVPLGGARQVRTLTVEGETKTVTDWLEDDRCKLKSRAAFFKRMERHWDPADIIGLPDGCTPDTAVRAFGQIKSFRQWADDPKCKIGYEGLRRRILVNKMDPEEAITIPAGHRTTTITAYGQTLLPGEWSEHPRCTVSPKTIVDRIKAGWSPEAAISTPRPGGAKLSAADLFERELQIGEPFKAIRADLVRSAALATGAEVQCSNQYQVSEAAAGQRFCFGIWAEISDMMALVAKMCELAFTDPDFVDQTKAALAMMAASKVTKEVGSGTLVLFPGWRAVDADGAVWRGSNPG